MVYSAVHRREPFRRIFRGRVLFHRAVQPRTWYGKTEREAWEGYKGRFPAILARAVKDRVFARKQDVEEFFRLAAREGRTVLDAAGEPVLELEGARAGLTRETLMQPDSDPMVAERLMLARVDATLKAAPKDRESLGEFREDWQILQELGRAQEGGETLAVK
jgi:hypothetical protein